MESTLRIPRCGGEAWIHHITTVWPLRPINFNISKLILDSIMCHTKEIKGHFTHKIEDPWPLYSKISHWSKKAKTVQVHFTLEGEGLRAKSNYHGWKVHMGSYMAGYINNVSCFSKIFVRPTSKRRAWLKFHKTMSLKQLVRPLDEIRGP